MRDPLPSDAAVTEIHERMHALLSERASIRKLYTETMDALCEPLDKELLALAARARLTLCLPK